jgi:hypothetical protein
MLIVLASALILLAMLDRALRHERITNAQIEARFTFFAIRDDLRRLGRDGVLPEDRWFAYMDATLTRSTVAVERIHLWNAIAYLRVCDFQMVERAEKNRARAMKKLPALADIHSRYGECVRNLIGERHKLLWQVLGVVGRGILTVARTRARMLQVTNGLETSALLEYGCGA